MTIKDMLIKCEKIKYEIISETKYPKATPTNDEIIATKTLPSAKFK